MVVRRDMNVESFGTMAELPPDLSPLQIGSKGHYAGRAFTLIGRLRLQWSEGSWTEWCADFGNGTIGWVAEAMGFYMVSFEHPGVELRGVPANPRVNEKFKIGNTLWLVKDVKGATCIAAEGELPHVAPPGWKRVGIDLVGDQGEFGSLELTDDGRSFFEGHYATFEELHFSDLRKVPGWDQDAEITRKQSQAMGCPACAAPVELRAQGLTTTAVCGSCGTMLDTSTPDLKRIGKVAETTLKLMPLLPIGRRGTFRNETWEVIGFMRREDQWSAWFEYLLFNPWQGFRWLVNFNGHWTWVVSLPAHQGEPKVNGEKFKLFAAEEVVVTDVLGEFFWRVKAGEKVELRDFIAPPRILSGEASEEYNEITWSLGEYVPATEVAAAFQVTNLPRPAGILLNQPNPHGERWKKVRGKFFMLLLVYVIVQMLFLGMDTEYDVLKTDLVYESEKSAAGLVTPTFKLQAGSAPVHVVAQTSLPEDTYLGLKGSLIHSTTQQTTPFSLPLTNYTTAPGGDKQETRLPSIPAGDYYVRLIPDGSPTIERAPIRLMISQGGLFWSNFWMGFVLICLWPIFVRMRRSGFEKRRWAQSDFSP